MIRLPKVTAGEPIKAELFNDLVDAIKERTPPIRVPGGRITTGPNGWTLAMSPGKGGGAPAAAFHPFQAIAPAPYAGAGSPPASQARTFAVRPGMVAPWSSAPRLPANLSQQFTAPNNTERYYCWLDAAFTSDGDRVTLSSLTYAAGTEVPAIQESGDAENVYPTRWCLPLFAVTTEDGRIKEVEQYVMSSLSIALVVTGVGCATQQRSVFWSSL